MTPKNENDMWMEEYVHALENFNIAMARLKVAVDSVRLENNKLRSELLTYQQLWKSAEKTIEEYGMKEDDTS